MQNVRINDAGNFDYTNDNGTKARANFPLFIIRKAWENGCDLEDLADGFGKGNGTMGDWSGIRDSTTEATNLMLERAFRFIDGRLDMAKTYLRLRSTGEIS
jgi:hypothetical protein